MSKLLHTYCEPIKLEVEYKYDKDHNKVYNLKQLKRHFKRLTAKLK
tara:strand:- start:4870 stop:5007 length:138 start_codon:yes stop_codon:yes gene_type:complete